MTMVDNRRIIDQTQAPTKRISDGPLIIRDSPENVNKENEDNTVTILSVNSVGPKTHQEDLIPYLVKPTIQEAPVITNEFLE
ncbi:hypothetical protein WUBG_18325, partial [Wuchereria bancrofti]